MSHAPVIVRNGKLDDSSPRHPQSALKYEPRSDSSWSRLNGEAMTPRMWSHQRVALYAMRTMETDPVRSAIKLSNDEVVDITINYSVGVYCDPPGSGKTAVVASLLAFHDLPESRKEVPFGSVMRGMAACYPAAPIVLERCSLVVVTHNIIAQWRKTLKNIGMREDVDFKVVHKVTEEVDEEDVDAAPAHPTAATDADADAEGTPQEKQQPRKRKRINLLTSVIDDALSGRYRVLLVSNTAYEKIIDLRPDLPIRVSFQRVVIDEADSISISNFVLMPSRFLWLVTATADCFQIDSKACKEDRGCLRQLAHYLKVPSDFKTGSSYEHMRDVYRRNIQSMHYAAKEFAFVHCDEDYILANQGIQKPTMVKMTGNAKLHRLHERGIISSFTQTALETGRFIAADATAEGNVEARCWKNPINSLTNPYSRDKEVHAHLVEYLNSERICALTLKTMDAAADADDIIKLPCCKANVNRRALARVMEIVNEDSDANNHNKCPACRHGDLSGVKLSGVDPMSDGEMRKCFRSMSVFADVAGIIRQHDGKRILVFLSAGTKKNEMIESLNTLFEIQAHKLQGTQKMIEKRITEFKEKKKSVLIIGNGQSQGINLEMADVLVFMHTMSEERFKQMVGRGQRPGRSGVLLVYHMQAK